MGSKKQGIGNRHHRPATGDALNDSAMQRNPSSDSIGLSERHAYASFTGDYRRALERQTIRNTPGARRRRRPREETLDGMQLMTVTDVCKMLRISKPTLWRIRRAGEFPEPTTVTQRVFGWRRLEVEFWLASRQTSRRY